MSHTLLNYAFLFFWRYFGEFHTELFFLNIRVTISETSNDILRIFFFLPCLKGENPEENFDLFEKCCWSNQWKETNINKNCFSPKSEPHTVKLYLPVVLKHFGEIHQELFFLVKNVTISETSTEILRKFVFHRMFE